MLGLNNDPSLIDNNERMWLYDKLYCDTLCRVREENTIIYTSVKGNISSSVLNNHHPYPPAVQL